MKKFLMCPPRQFDVSYVINPWMAGNLYRPDKTLAEKQWTRLKDELTLAGAEVLLTPVPPANCPDAVFTANAGFLLLKLGVFLRSNFHHVERQPEQDFFMKFFSGFGWECHTVGAEPGFPAFEGAGDALFSPRGDYLFLGHGFRTNELIKWELAAWLVESGCLTQVIPLELVDPRFYHLDTCLCPTDLGFVIWYPGAFSPRSQAELRGLLGHNSIEVEESEAEHFACNAVSLGQNLITPLIPGPLADRLTSVGFVVKQVDMSEYLQAGGACKCLTLEIG